MNSLQGVIKWSKEVFSDKILLILLIFILVKEFCFIQVSPLLRPP